MDCELLWEIISELFWRSLQFQKPFDLFPDVRQNVTQTVVVFEFHQFHPGAIAGEIPATLDGDDFILGSV